MLRSVLAAEQTTSLEYSVTYYRKPFAYRMHNLQEQK